jgi:hypothetical protein
MRKLIFIGFIALGALVGLVSAAKKRLGNPPCDDGSRCTFRSAHWRALASIGRKERQRLEWDENPLPGMGTTPKDLAANYWRDKGHPPFMKPSEAEPDKHMFDPDRLG